MNQLKIKITRIVFVKSLFNQSFVSAIVLCFTMLIFQKQAVAQTQTGISSMAVNFKLHVNPANPLDTLDPTQDVVYTLVLNDTANVKKIYLNAGISEGGSDVFNLAFKIDNKNNLPPGVSYTRTGNLLMITVAAQHLRADYFYQAKTENNSGNFSNPHTYHFNK